ncbi:MFS transporter [Streptomyces sp. V17-9]|uniref:MFS transporter n=1 Tax=Streptomyces sp. V17-9 TaxID=2831149 RepID=UPI001BAEE8EF|nr:MFS transporter [Streptomyces sp. V17-9]QUW93897.1 Multidrug export protein EmrB [Streptomyces sp. V17-9]
MSKSSVVEVPSATSGNAPFAATVATVSVMGVLVVGQMYVTIPLMPQLADAWNVSTGSAAASTTAFAFAHAVGSLVSGPLSTRFGRRTVMVTSVLAMAVVTAVLPLVGSLVPGVGLRALQGLFAGSFIPMAYAYLNARFEPRRASLALTVVSACMGATVVIGQVEAQLVASLAGWVWVFWGTVPLLLAGAAVSWRVLLPEGRQETGPAGERSRSPLRAALSPRVIPLYLVILVGAGSLTAAYTGVQLYGPDDVAGGGAPLLALRASALPALLGAVLIAPALARVPASRRAVAALAVTAAAMLAAALGGDDAVTLGAALFAFMAGFSTLGPALIQSVGARAGAAAQTTAIALYGFTLNVGAGAGAQIAALFDRFGDLALFLALALAVATLGVARRSRTT